MTNKSILLTIFLAFNVVSPEIYASNKPDFSNLYKAYSTCQNHFNNTSFAINYNECTNAVFDKFDNEIKKTRELNQYAIPQKWLSINKELNSQLNICLKSSVSTQKNSTILKDSISCKFIYYSNLLDEAVAIIPQ